MNTHQALLNDFDKHFIETGIFARDGSFKDEVLQINKQEATPEFAKSYFTGAEAFVNQAKFFRIEPKEIQH